jgi:hypothetical protein
VFGWCKHVGYRKVNEMPDYVYRVVPFAGRARPSVLGFPGNLPRIAGELESLINTQASEGWEFSGIGHVQAAMYDDKVLAQGGLILKGERLSEYPDLHFEAVVFRRPK